MKKTTLFLLLGVIVIATACASRKPQRPAPMRKSKWRHGGSVVMNIPQQPILNHISA